MRTRPLLATAVVLASTAVVLPGEVKVEKNVAKNDPPGFMIYGQREHRATPATLGHKMQAALKSKGVWNKMVHVPKAGHVPGKNVLINARRRDKAVFAAFDQFLDMVCYAKGKPKSGELLTVGKK